MTAIALTIAGSDSGGGAGIQADLKTFSALGVYGASAITAITAQNTRGVQGIHDIPPAYVAQQIHSVLSDLKVGAIKIGMLSVPETIRALRETLEAYQNLPIVLDPVMVATSGDSLLSENAVQTLLECLVPKALIITPNLPEAAKLLRSKIAQNETEMQAQGEALLAFGSQAVLMKGGHQTHEKDGVSAQAVDFLITKTGTLRLPAPRIATQNTHGTGCTLSAAIAAGLAKGEPLEIAVRHAKTYVSAAIQAADQLSIGHGHGPTHHFHAWWPQ
jgi:hydroxymethylpyrimidine/phosphomethylpyrimidine kinase